MTDKDKRRFDEAKAHHKKWMDSYSKEVNDYVNEYGNDNCDYLIHRRLMSNGHRMAWNALNDLYKKINT